MKMVKRIFAFAMMLCLLWVCVCPTEAMAATNYKGKTQKFLIRTSGSYASTGIWVTMTSTSADGKTGTIEFSTTFTIKKSLSISCGTVYDYKISSLKEGGKITLTYNQDKSELYGMPSKGSLYTMTGKIHIDSSKGCKIANIWKIDTLKYGSYWPSNSLGYYFRNN